VVKKKKFIELKKELEEEKKKNLLLEQQVDYLQSRLEEKDLLIEELKGKNELSSVFGEKTMIANQVASIFHYIENREYGKARIMLDIIFHLRQEKELHLYKFEDRHRKEFFSVDSDVQTQDARLKEAWLFMNYDYKERAYVQRRVYEVLKEKKEEGAKKESIGKQAGSQADAGIPLIPNILIPEILRVDRYILIKEIIGSDLFTFFSELDKKPSTKARAALIDILLEKQIEDNAYIRTRDYGFDKSLFITSSHSEKMLAVFEEAKILLRKDEKEKLASLVKQLDVSAHYPMRDGASWNFMISKEQADYFLSDGFLRQAEPDLSEIRERVRKSIYSYDFDKLVRMTFQSDDGIHATQWPLPRLSYNERLEKEKYYVKRLAEHGEDVKDYWALRTEEEFYRHARMWLFYRQNAQNYPDTDYKFKQHHLIMAYGSLYRSIFKREPKGEELKDVGLEKILRLVMHPGCGTKAVEYPARDAEK